MTAPTNERYVVTRTIPATPAEVFAVLADPVRHQETEPGDWVREVVEVLTAPLISFNLRAILAGCAKALET